MDSETTLLDVTAAARQDGATARVGATDQRQRLVSAKDAELARVAEQHRAEVACLVEQFAVKDEQRRQATVIMAQLTQRPAELPTPAPAPPPRRWWQGWRS